MTQTLRHLFTPHYTNNHRPRILHPTGLLMLGFVFVLFQLWITVLGYVPALPGGLVLGYASSIDSSQVIELTNVERAKLGLNALTHSGVLSQAAAAKATHMFQNDYWAHIAPDGTTPWSFMKTMGYQYSVAGENLARDFNDTSSMMVAWMNSPTHKDNIVSEKYSQIGVAVVNGTLQGVETTLVVQMFGAPVTTAVAQVPKAALPQEVRTQPAAVPQAQAIPTAIPQPQVLPTVALEQPQPAGLPIPADLTLGTSFRVNTRPAHTTLVSPLMLSKVVALSILMLLLGVLVYDEWLITHHKITRRTGKNWAHATLFSMALIIVLTMVQGKVI